ncbi:MULTISPECIES: hypothetical protein [unclassified Pseudonocardia]|uniref:hypothetical protein n=1 Tax=unclassified Pseudonocardia TaxID=2619320 RepID=UPI0001FFF140|nr:hypothetical protein [Pseudonocardia sp. Ae707_Ps1]OLM17088.1 hypothetical protein Ae707Ps1_1347c [Pseudonocardia sp. Ae707_Ps1]
MSSPSQFAVSVKGVVLDPQRRVLVPRSEVAGLRMPDGYRRSIDTWFDRIGPATVPRRTAGRGGDSS